MNVGLAQTQFDFEFVGNLDGDPELAGDAKEITNAVVGEKQSLAHTDGARNAEFAVSALASSHRGRPKAKRQRRSAKHEGESALPSEHKLCRMPQ